MTLSPYPKVYKVKKTPALLKRGGFLQRTTRLRMKRRTRPYGGSNEQFPNVGDFQRFIRERDGGVCQWCGLTSCQPVDVAHLLFKVGMGGRKRVSVNEPFNAVCLGRACHQKQETSKRITVWLVTRLLARYRYAIPRYALRRLEWCASEAPASGGLWTDNPWDSYSRETSACDGRKRA